MVIFRSISPFLLLLATVALAQPAGQRPLIAPPLVPSADFEATPAVASDGDGYLAVWNTGGGPIRMARLNAAGELLDPRGIAVSQRSAFSRPDVFWNGSSYVVVYDRMYALADRAGNVQASDLPISSPESWIDRAVTNGRTILARWTRLAGRNLVQGFTLYDAEFRVVRDSINVNAAPDLVPVADGYVVLAGSTVTKIADDGSTTTLATLPFPSIVIAVAAGGDGTNVLVAWSNGVNPSNPFIQTTLLTANGLGPVIDLPGAFGFDITITHANDGYLVTWWNSALYGMHLNAAGQPLDAAPIRMSADAPWRRTPRAASNGSSHLVVWQDGRRTPRSLMGDVWASYLSPGDDVRELPVALGRALQLNESVASNGAIALVAWDETAVEDPSRIVATRIAADGSLLDAGFEIAAKGERPKVATDGTGFLVAWSEPVKPVDGALRNFIRAARVGVDGAVGPMLTLSDAEVGTPGGIAFDGESYFVAWNDTPVAGGPLHVRGARVSRDGFLIDFEPFDYGEGRGASVSFNGTDYWLVFWQALGAIAQRISRDGFAIGAPLVLESPNPYASHETAIECHAGSCLAIWTRSEPVNVTNSDLAAAVLTSSGAGKRIQSLATAVSDEHPRIVVENGHFLVTWSAGEGARIGTNGDLLEKFVIEGRPPATPLVIGARASIIFGVAFEPDVMTRRLYFRPLAAQQPYVPRRRASGVR